MDCSITENFRHAHCAAFRPHIQTSLCVHWCGEAEEAHDQYQSCMADAGIRKMDLANAKSTILIQIREMIFQCDLTLKAVSRRDTRRASQ